MQPRLVIICLFLFTQLSYSQVQFVDRTALSEVPNPERMVSTDLNSDGLLDLVGVSAGELIWFENKDDYLFRGMRSIEVSGTVVNFLVSDLDQDGDNDVIVSGLFPTFCDSLDAGHNLAWLKNDGNNNFQEICIPVEAGDNIDNLQVHDLNGDGQLDISFHYYFSEIQSVGPGATFEFRYNTQFVWLDNTGSEVFNSQPVPIDEYNEQLNENLFDDLYRAIDFNNDGYLDLVGSTLDGNVSPYSSPNPQLQYYENDGLGSFASVELITPYIGTYSGLEAMDINQDGDDELIVITDNISSQVLNPVVAFDFENNGLESFDFISPDDMNISPETLSQIDMNNDGQLDLVLSHPSQGIQWIELPYNGPPDPVLTYLPYDADDFNNIRLLDLGQFTSDDEIGFLIHTFNNVRVCRPDQVGDCPSLINLNPDQTSLKLVDLNSDQLPECTLLDQSRNYLSVCENKGGGELHNPEIVYSAQEYIIDYAFLDVNVDGFKDLVSMSAENLYLHLATEDFIFQEPTILSFPFSDFMDESTLEVFDVDMDGDSDLIVSRFETTVGLNENGSLNFTVIHDNACFDSCFEDMDSDGDPDLICIEYIGDRPIKIFSNDGSGAFSDLAIASLSTVQVSSVEVGDLDHDGDSDLAFLYVNFDESIDWIENLGDGTYSEAQDILDVNSKGILVEDFNNDGGSDVFSSDHDSGGSGGTLGTSGGFITIEPSESTFIRSIDGGSFGIRQEISLNHRYDSFIAADFDNDNDIDIVATRSTDNTIMFHENIRSLPVAEFIVPQTCPLILESQSAVFLPDATFFWESSAGSSSNSSSTFSPPEFGTFDYSLVVCNTLGCDTVTQTIANLMDVFSADIPTTGQTNTPLTFTSTTFGATNWSWTFGDGNISTEESATHTYTEAGTYTVEVFVTNSEIVDCTHHFTTTIEIVDEEINIGINPQVSFTSSISPNPANEFFIVDISNTDEVFVEVHTIDGKVVHQSIMQDSSKGINIEDLSDGLYIVVLSNEEGAIAHKLIVAR